jgi:hypothetical protein
MRGLSMVLGLLLQFAPRRWLQEQLDHRWPGRPATARCVPFFSGRVALHAIASGVPAARRVALLPAYLCNVVHLAFERAGWRIVTYDVDDAFVPDPRRLEAALREHGAALLLLAPLYGSDGGMPWWLRGPGRALREATGLTLVLDLCQDAALLREVPPDPGARWAVVLSFNDKSMPGVMGAAVWTDLPLDEPLPPGRRHAGLLALWALRKTMPRRRAAAEEAALEFSRAQRFPYDFAIGGAARLQLALGLVGMALLPRWQARRRAAVERGEITPLPLPHAATAPFVVCPHAPSAGHRAKRPYARHDDPLASLKPALRIHHNKGFDDR